MLTSFRRICYWFQFTWRSTGHWSVLTLPVEQLLTLTLSGPSTDAAQSTFLSICKQRPSKKTNKTFWRDGKAFSKWTWVVKTMTVTVGLLCCSTVSVWRLGSHSALASRICPGWGGKCTKNYVTASSRCDPHSFPSLSFPSVPTTDPNMMKGQWYNKKRTRASNDWLE